jgi:hypothetical protein
MSLTPREREIRRRLRDDFPHYAQKCLWIKPKDPRLGLQPLILNAAQQYLHGRLEAQRERIGMVRVLVLKGRQQGISTYIGGRFYWRTSHSRGMGCYILTHEQKATDNLFGMVDRYHQHCPPLVKPVTGAANAKELSFSKLDSGYAVGTAGTKAVGRSNTFQLFHGSEVAFWPNAKDHFAGVVQTVPELPGTEIILESTANGVGGEFHERWQQAEAGIGDYEAIFIPWFWSPEYARPVPPGFVLDDEEQAYADAHGLTLEQMAWRRNKIAELKDEMLFKQEYPATAAEAFQMTGHDSFIKPEAVVKARKANLEGIGPLILGVDPKRFGNDRFSIAWRRGRKVLKVESKAEKIDTVAGANWVKQVIDSDHPARVFIDVGGVGAGVYDLLNAWGYGFDPMTPWDKKRVVVPVDFSGTPQQPDLYILVPGKQPEKRPGPFNRRAEIWMRSRDWLGEPGGADIPDTDSLQADACGPQYHYNANSYLLIESKEHMRDVRKVRSPDEWDAVALTFADSVAEYFESDEDDYDEASDSGRSAVAGY